MLFLKKDYIWIYNISLAKIKNPFDAIFDKKVSNNKG